MNFVAPEALIFWTTIFFILFFFLLAKYAWKPILNAVKERENTINNSLAEAEKARQEMQDLTASNEKILKEARVERENMLKEAREIKENLISEAKDEANIQSNKMIEQAKASIEIEKQAAITDIKNQVASLSIGIAEKVIKDELSNKDKQLKLIDKMLDDATLN